MLGEMDFWKQTAIVSVFLVLFGLSSALLELSQFPDELRECYEFRSYNMTPSDQDAINIQNFCYRQYQYKQLAKGNMGFSPNITQEGINYIQGLFRQILNEAREVHQFHQSSKRHKRQAFPGRYRQEVRSPGAYPRYANCILRLQREVIGCMLNATCNNYTQQTNLRNTNFCRICHYCQNIWVVFFNNICCFVKDCKSLHFKHYLAKSDETKRIYIIIIQP